tara:strand:+ start:167 stop:925 length:759 start_codon:yes stop_codon:yes gene_type:complete
MKIEIFALENLPEFDESSNLAEEIFKSLRQSNSGFENNDIVIVTQKIVSKSEGKIVDIRYVRPTDNAKEIAKQTNKDPRLVQLILNQSKSIIRIEPERGIIITETIHGFICANAGIDASNIPGDYNVCLLPENANISAQKISETLTVISGFENVPVIITDTFGRPWREGHLSFAIGSFGIAPLKNYEGTIDQHGKILKVTTSATIDIIATAAELVSGKSSGTPVSIIRGFQYSTSTLNAETLLRPIEKDLFR